MSIDLSDSHIFDFHAHIPAANNLSQVVDTLFGRWLPTAVTPAVNDKYKELKLKTLNAADRIERATEMEDFSTFCKKEGLDHLRTQFEQQLHTIPSFRSFIHYVANVYSCTPDIASIDKAMAPKLRDSREYLSEILERENIARVVLDLFGETEVSNLFPAEKACWVYRFDRMMQPSWAKEYGLRSMSQILDSVQERLHDAVKKGCVGFKSTLAYSRSLHLSEVTRKQASDALHVLSRRQVQNAKALISYQDFLYRYVLAESGNMGFPVLFHLGLGGAWAPT